MIKMIGKKKILVAPLDWGLGHATRCIPIISQLLSAGHDVSIAAGGQIKTLLKQEFPELFFLPLPGYHIKYGRNKWELMVNIFFQIPKILATIKKENQWLHRVIRQYHFDVVISDNRYGLYHPKVRSIFVTHQLLIRSPVFQKQLQAINYKFINRFDECWVPDYAGAPNLAGNLSHPAHLPQIPVQYIGPLSRFLMTNKQKPDRHLLVLFSGPEPQRTLFEEKVLRQLNELHDVESVIVVRGLPGSTSLPPAKPGITIYNHLSASELQQLFDDAYLVVARSGYSTVMDIVAMQKKSILVPTPGQTEQEYLANHLMMNGMTFCVKQNEFELGKAIKESASFSYHFITKPSGDLLQKAIEGLTDKIVLQD